MPNVTSGNRPIRWVRFQTEPVTPFNQMVALCVIVSNESSISSRIEFCIDPGWFKRHQLALQQGGTCEVAASGLQPLRNQAWRSIEKDKTDGSQTGSQEIPVAALQCRARNDDRYCRNDNARSHTAFSNGPRSASVSGMSCRMRSTLSAECRSSASTKAPQTIAASRRLISDLPHPATPMTTMKSAWEEIMSSAISVKTKQPDRRQCQLREQHQSEDRGHKDGHRRKRTLDDVLN